MFWKKKKESESPKKETKPAGKGIIKSTPAETREAFRIAPLPSDPIELEFSGKIVDVVDISVGGLSFHNDGFELGEQEVEFSLPGGGHLVQAKLNLIKIIEDKNLCRCRFINLHPDDEDMISRYVLERQKHDLKAKKGMYT